MALNQTGVKKVTAVTPKTILAVPEMAIAFPIKVANTGVSPDSDNKKIIKAGTPITGSLEARDTAFTVVDTSASSVSATGVLLHDVDVTAGTANATILVQGVVDVEFLESDVQTALNAKAKAALNKIIFIK